MHPPFTFHSLLLLLLLLYYFSLSLILAIPLPIPFPLSLPPLLDTIINTTITLSTLNSPPPALLTTKLHSEECININQGQLLCCEDLIDGDQPVVLEAARLFGLSLNRDSGNGVACKDLNDGGYCPAVEHRLCCQVTDLEFYPSQIITPTNPQFNHS
ncbi:predicted protein [Sclerotinia sclerotiorum 1980 UF-70]|uniref:Hydrophobin n=1 Tax=Sclerotinia sclerotiorum (strain ATCC 18683 / 1980 / Ss-1) TaxID=665079 RepID=A7EV98_SCLS1|nr:predicted protein [Sclerotinia sclerotiorum 1980 UF-70]EDN93390.1 predicted protein [Sclerotinia sclerotiorum 1980 UF-70]